MKSLKSIAVIACLPVVLLVGVLLPAQTTHRPLVQERSSSGTPTPFQTNNGDLPPSGQYSGPLCELNHTWPTKSLGKLENAPWQAAIGNGRITTENAAI